MARKMKTMDGNNEMCIRDSRCCGALWGFRGYEELAWAGADFLAAAPMDICRYL